MGSVHTDSSSDPIEVVELTQPPVCFYFLLSFQSWIPPLSKYYHYLQPLHALHPHYHISSAQQQQQQQRARTLPTVHLLFSNSSVKPSEQRMQMKSVAAAPEVLAIGHIGLASSLSRPLQLLAPQQITRFGRLHSDTFNSGGGKETKKKRKKNQKRV